MSGPRVRLLGAADAPAFEAFLGPRAESSLFLLANARRAGLEDSGRPFTGAYAGAFQGESLAAVAAHFWNGIVALQAPAHLKAVLRRAAGASGRAVAGLTGPYDQVVAARAALGAALRPAAVEEPEGLFVLDLKDLRVPDALVSGTVRCRRPQEEDFPLLFAWRAAYLPLFVVQLPVVIDPVGSEPGGGLEDVLSIHRRQCRPAL